MLRLYDFPLSGNCYKIRLLLNQLSISFERVEVNIVKGGSRTPEFLHKNPNGKVPVLELEDGKFLSESNAILCYLSEETIYLPEENFAKAQVMQWLFFEQFSHEPNIATPRFWVSILGKSDDFREQLEQKQKLGYAALGVMEKHLSKHNFFVEESYSIADIALFAYTHVADEGGFDLNRFPAIEEWIARVKNQPGYVGLQG